MSKKVTFKPDKEGIRTLLKSPQMQAVIESWAQEVYKDEDYEIVVRPTRAVTHTKKTMAFEIGKARNTRNAKRRASYQKHKNAYKSRYEARKSTINARRRARYQASKKK